MARDGSGNYNLPVNAIVPAHSQTNSSNFNATINDIAAALTQSLSKDGQTVATGNLPMGGYRHLNVGAAQSRTEYARFDQVQDQGFGWGSSAGGSQTALTIYPNPPITAYVEGQHFTFGTTSYCTGTATLSVSGLPAKNIVRPRWDAFTIVEVVWASTDFYQISGGVRDIPVDSVIFFRQASAPVGWQQQIDANDRLLRVVNTAGGGYGGDWSISGLATSTVADHAHTVTGATVGENETHTHGVSITTGGPSATRICTITTGGPTAGNEVHTHAVVGNTGVANNAHTHNMSFSSAAGGTHNHTVAGDGSWRPAYIDIIACQKDAT